MSVVHANHSNNIRVISGGNLMIAAMTITILKCGGIQRLVKHGERVTEGMGENGTAGLAIRDPVGRAMLS